MTASGFRAFFPPNGGPPPSTAPTTAAAAAQLQHLIPNMRFLAQKLENPNLFPNFMPAMSTPLNNLDRTNPTDEEGDEVSTSNNSYTPECAANNAIDHGTESGKSQFFFQLGALIHIRDFEIF